MGKHTSNETRERLIEMVLNQKLPLKLAAAALKLNYKNAARIMKIFSSFDRIDKKKPTGRPVKY